MFKITEIMDKKLRITLEIKDKDFPNYESRKYMIFWEYGNIWPGMEWRVCKTVKENNNYNNNNNILSC